ATFLGVDAATQGNWPSKYGGDGYTLDSAPTSLPPDVSVTLIGGLTDLYDVIDAPTTSDPRALKKPVASDRLLASWTGDFGFTLDINLTDGQAHQVALYVLDTKSVDRQQRLDVLSAA